MKSTVLLISTTSMSIWDKTVFSAEKGGARLPEFSGMTRPFYVFWNFDVDIHVQATTDKYLLHGEQFHKTI